MGQNKNIDNIVERDFKIIPAVEISGITADAKPLISVLMLAWNHELYIAQAIESILNQRCDFSLEIIIGEDRSRDRTREVCEDYQRRFPGKIRLIVSDGNVGMHRNFARIWHRARGKYIAFLEGDDYWIDDKKLSKQVALMEDHPDYTLCGAYTEVIRRGEGKQWVKKGGIRPAVIKETYSVEDLIPNYTFHFSSVLLRKECVQFPRWFWNMYCVDRPLYLLCAEKGPVGLIPEVASVYRMHDGGIWSPINQLVKAHKGIELFKTLDRYFIYKYKSIIRRTLGSIIWSYMDEALRSNDRVSAKKLFWLSIKYQLPKIKADQWRAINIVLLRLYVPLFYNKARKLKSRLIK